MAILRRSLHVIDIINEWTGRIFAPLISVLALVVFYEVMARYLFNRPTSWAHDVSSFFLIALTMGGFGYTLLHKAHVNMDVLYVRFPTRTRAILDVISFPLFFIFCAVLVWKGFDMALTSIDKLETTTSPFRGPMYLVKPMVPIGASLALLQGLATLVRNLITAITGKEETV